MKQKTPKWRVLIFSLIMSFGVVVFCFVIAEITLRLFAPQNTEPNPRGLYAKDPELDFVLAPKISGVSKSPEWNVKVETNSIGIRERELTKKAIGERRILILGDSFTFGSGVEVEEVYPRQVEGFLQSGGLPNFTVINAGVPAYSTFQEVIWFERIVDLIQPDAVILGFFLGNDFHDNILLNKYDVISGYLVTKSVHGSRLSLTERLGIPPEIKIMLRTKLHLYVFLMNIWSTTLVRAGLADTDEMFEIYQENLTQKTMEIISKTRDALSRLTALCHKRSLPLGLVLIPDGRVAEILDQKRGYQFERPAKIVSKLVEIEGIPVLDLSRDFKEKSDLYFPVDGHWNAKGHLVAGRIIAKSLLDGKLKALLDKQ